MNCEVLKGGGGSTLKQGKLFCHPYCINNIFIVSNVVIVIYIYCLYAINVHKCIKLDNLQAKIN